MERLESAIRERFGPCLPHIYTKGAFGEVKGLLACCSPNPRLYPIIRLAMLARLLGTNLGELLSLTANSQEYLNVTSIGQIRPRWVKGNFLAECKLSAAPERIEHVDQARVRQRAVRPSHWKRNWDETDVALADKVRARAAVLRATTDRPIRIWARVLAKAVGAERWRRATIWGTKLNRFHKALVECADTDISFATRLLAWSISELECRRRRQSRSFRVFIHASGLKNLAKKKDIEALARRTFEFHFTSDTRARDQLSFDLAERRGESDRVAA